MRVEKLSTRQGLSTVLEKIRRQWSLEDAVKSVEPVVRDVKSRCYEAVMEYSCKLDGVCYSDPLVSKSEASSYEELLDYRVIEAVERVVESVREYSRSIMPKNIVSRGVKTVWQPVRSVAVYVPGGRHAYPSTAIMTVTPASVAGVREIHVLTPPRSGRARVDPAVAVAAYRAGATAVYAVGGPHAIAGVAYGCSPLPRVDMVAGPGGPYVQAAKLLVSSIVAIDMLAGPTELFIVAGRDCDARRVVFEALAQAEHGPTSTVVIATPEPSLLDRVESLLYELKPGGELAAIYLVSTSSLEEALELADMYAPEHLLILGFEPSWLPRAGAISLGVPTAYLDYAAGPSHVLPTNTAARWRGGLSVYDFLKPVAVVDPDSLDPGLVEAAKVLAEYEGFNMHKRSLENI